MVAGWISRQKLDIIVDFTSGLNLFPNLRLVNNDSIAYNKSMLTIEKVMEKMEANSLSDLMRMMLTLESL